jgi:uncharacterized repeat protein (TIGR01451 family)
MAFTSRVNAQVAAMPFTPSLDTFNVITGTTVDTPNADDVAYSNLPIGFNFYYHGTSYNMMTATTNGYISFDSINFAQYINVLTNTTNNIIAPLGADLINHLANASLQYLTIGTAPNRICIIQWLHYSYFGNFNGDLNFQIQLYETSNCIRFVYGFNVLLNSPFNTQIGLKGDSNLDYIALGDTSCNWANAYPYPSINTLFPISMSCSMPSGFAFHFGSCMGNGMTNFGYITGKVFNDLNGNGVMDSIETGIPNHIVHIMPGNYYVSTDASGDYNFFFTDSTLTYSLNTGAILYWTQTTTPLVLTCNPATQACSGYNFGFHQLPGVNDVAIHCPNWGTRPGTPEPMPIWYENNGTSNLSDTIIFVMDSLYSYISASPAPVYNVGKTLKWTYSNLQPGQHGCIMLYLLPDTSAVLGNYLNSTLTILPLNDTLPANNVLALHQLISTAWDPNEKIAEPSGIFPAGSTIKYTVHFQNTGTSAADNVVINDQLDQGLDPLTFNLIGSSHPVNFTMTDNGRAIFTFYNINLPDSNTNFMASNGYVSFSINTKSILAPLTVINNTASIKFDYNVPIVTNITADTIRGEITTNINSLTYNTHWKVYPNPSSDKVVFKLAGNTKEHSNLKIMNMEGQKVFENQNLISNQSIDITSLANGVYFCIIQSENNIETIKLVKQK